MSGLVLWQVVVWVGIPDGTVLLTLWHCGGGNPGAPSRVGGILPLHGLAAPRLGDSKVGSTRLPSPRPLGVVSEREVSGRLENWGETICSFSQYNNPLRSVEAPVYHVKRQEVKHIKTKSLPPSLLNPT